MRTAVHRTRGQWEELLAPLFAQGLSQSEAARRVGFSRSRINEVCKRYGIGPQRRFCPCCKRRLRDSC